MKESFVSKLLKICLYFLFAAGILVIVTAPFLFEAYMAVLFGINSLDPFYRAFIVPFLMAEGCLGLWILGELLYILRSVPSGPFIRKNVLSLRRMGIAGLIAGALFAGKCFYLLTPLTTACVFLLLICSLGAFTLSDLFRQAVLFKEENDLTI